MDEKIWVLSDLIDKSDSIVFFGGTTVSKLDGIPGLRSIDQSLSAKPSNERLPEELLHIDTIRRLPTQFFTYYRANILNTIPQLNKAHQAFASLDRQGKLDAVITQNIDGLHKLAGCTNVLALQGSIQDNYCVVCNEAYSLSFVQQEKLVVPRCKRCGGVVRPDIALYGEEFKPHLIETAKKLVSECDMLIVGGISLRDYPSASLLLHYLGDKLVLISKDKSGYDERADLVIYDDIVSVLSNAITEQRRRKFKLASGGKYFYSASCEISAGAAMSV